MFSFDYYIHINREYAPKLLYIEDMTDRRKTDSISIFDLVKLKFYLLK